MSGSIPQLARDEAGASARDVSADPGLRGVSVPDHLEVPPPTLGSTIRAYWELGKPRLSMLNVVAVLAGAWLPYHEDVFGAGPGPDRVAVWGACLGSFLLAVASGAVNMWLERDLDRRMQRTADRPLPSGRLSPRAVLTYGAVLLVAGVLILALTTNLLATTLCVLVFGLYTGVYTPLKRHTSLNTLIGAIPGALPPVVGYAATMGRVGLDGLLVFLLVFFWQIPHFLAIAWRYRRDYAAAGMVMLPTLDPTGVRTARQLVAWVLSLAAISAMPWGLGLRDDVFLAVVLWLNVLFIVPTVWAAATRSDLAMRMTFRASLLYLPGMLAAWVFCNRPH